MLSSSFTRISGHGDFKVNVFMFLLFLRNKIKNKKMLPDCGKITHGPDALFFFCFCCCLRATRSETSRLFRWSVSFAHPLLNLNGVMLWRRNKLFFVSWLREILFLFNVIFPSNKKWVVTQSLVPYFPRHLSWSKWHERQKSPLFPRAVEIENEKGKDCMQPADPLTRVDESCYPQSRVSGAALAGVLRAGWQGLRRCLPGTAGQRRPQRMGPKRWMERLLRPYVVKTTPFLE